MKKLKNIFINNTKRKIFSFLISICIWVFIYNYNDPVITKPFYNIPVEIINEESLTSINKVYEIIEGNTINLKIKGKQSIVNSLKIPDITATADLDKLSEVNAVRIHVNIKNNYKDQLEIIYNEIDTLKVELDDYVEKTFKVEINELGELSEKYYIKSRQLNTQSVKISGAKKLVSRIASVVIDSNLSNVKPSYYANSKIKLYDNYGTIINNPKLEMSKKTVKISYDVLETKIIPVKINLLGKIPYGYNLLEYKTDVSKINIAGNEEDLKNIKSIDLSYNISNLKNNLTKEYDIQSNLNDKYINISNKQKINLNIFVEKLAIKDFIIDISELKLQNLPLNTEFSYLNNDKIILKIMGKESDLKTLGVEILNPYIDLKDSVVGENEVPISIYNLENIELINNPKIFVELKESIKIDDIIDNDKKEEKDENNNVVDKEEKEDENEDENEKKDESNTPKNPIDDKDFDDKTKNQEKETNIQGKIETDD